MEITKTCSKCGEVKAVEMFLKRKGQCKDCLAAWHVVYRKINKEKIGAREKNYRETHKQQIAERNRRYVSINFAGRKQYQQKWRQNNQDSLLKIERRRRQRDAIKIKQFRDSLPDCRVKQAIAAQIGVPANAIPPELVEVKRKHLQLLRKIKELTND